MKYGRFEDLPCWITARQLRTVVYRLINQRTFRRDFTLRNQIWSSAGSAMDSIAEGFDDGSPREFRRFLGYSQRSCSEVQSQLYRALDCEYITPDQFREAYELAGDCRKRVKGFRRYLRDRESVV
jgi:four helix bundle protein